MPSRVLPQESEYHVPSEEYRKTEGNLLVIDNSTQWPSPFTTQMRNPC